jgi:hypothetical protein
MAKKRANGPANCLAQAIGLEGHWWLPGRGRKDDNDCFADLPNNQ